MADAGDKASRGIETYRNTVYPWQCDAMGHMNTQFYAASFDAAQYGLSTGLARFPVWRSAAWAGPMCGN